MTENKKNFYFLPKKGSKKRKLKKRKIFGGNVNLKKINFPLFSDPKRRNFRFLGADLKLAEIYLRKERKLRKKHHKLLNYFKINQKKTFF